MGNFFALCAPNTIYCHVAPPAVSGNSKVLRIVKTDGKILGYRRPMLVNDIMMNFSGHGIGISGEASRCLPMNYELKIGHVYYLLPLRSTLERPVIGSSHSSVDYDSVRGIKRIKVIMTKQELEELVYKKISVEEMVLRLEEKARHGVDSLKRWRPMLETIPEGNGPDEDKQGQTSKIQAEDLCSSRGTLST